MIQVLECLPGPSAVSYTHLDVYKRQMEGNKMKPQEYLDREDEYKIIFFFSDSTAWNAVKININGWTWYIQNEED